ncbi:MAG: DoxX family protein [Planctomycetes bacterium]|nr:DoxX family protein [Planctomycetota bacterium]
MIQRLFVPPRVGLRASAGLLMVRVVMGTAFVLHGWGKIQNPFGWMGEGASIPGSLQALAALSEFGGGIALIAGLLVPLASFGLSCTMAVAAFTHISRGDPFVGSGATFEPALVYFSLALLLMLAGPGRASLDAFIFKSKASS